MGTRSTRPASQDDDLESFWTELRPKLVSKPSQWELPKPEAVQNWVATLDEGAQSLLGVKGPSLSFRNEAYQWCYIGGTAGRTDQGELNRWLTENPITVFTDRVRRLGQGQPWGIFSYLTLAPEFTLAEPLYSLVDEGFLVTELFHAIWEARFLMKERAPAGALLEALPKWVLGATLTAKDTEALEKAHVTREVKSTAEHLELLFFLLALAKQNGMFEHAVFIFDDVDRALHHNPNLRTSLLNDLHELTTTAKRWAKFGSSTGIVLGYSGSPGFYKTLEESHAQLFTKLVCSESV